MAGEPDAEHRIDDASRIFEFLGSHYVLLRERPDRWEVARAVQRGDEWYQGEIVTDFDRELVQRIKT